VQRHGSQERMERAASPSAPFESSPSGSLFHFCKRRAFRAMALVATVQPTAATHEYASFINKKVADQADGVWTTGTVQCLHEGILPLMTRIQHVLPANSIFPNKSQPFTIVWADDTDSICHLPCLLTYLDNHRCNRHRTNAMRESSTTGRSIRRASNGAAAPSTTLPSCGHSLSPRRQPHKVRFFCIP
jgi:hypothetical protein